MYSYKASYETTFVESVHENHSSSCWWMQIIVWTTASILSKLIPQPLSLASRWTAHSASTRDFAVTSANDVTIRSSSLLSLLIFLRGRVWIADVGIQGVEKEVLSSRSDVQLYVPSYFINLYTKHPLPSAFASHSTLVPWAGNVVQGLTFFSGVPSSCEDIFSAAKPQWHVSPRTVFADRWEDEGIAFRGCQSPSVGAP